MSHQPLPTERAGSLVLNAEDVRRLLEDKTSATRIDMSGRISSTYGSQALNEQELRIAEQIFRLMVRDTELRVRTTLSQNLKDSGHAPRDIVLAMARDVEEVSLPVLQYSQVLSDDDLIELIRHGDNQPKLVAISKRKSVSDTLADTLLEKGNDEVAKTLVNNEGAQISDAGFDKIIQKHAADETLMKAVSNRPRLPPAVTEKLVHVVSSSLAETLKKRHSLPIEQIEKEVEKARESETLNLVRVSQSQEEVDKLVNQLAAFNRLTPSLILSALCQGNFNFFEISLARLSNIPVANARTLISDRGELGFRAIYNKSGLPDAMFPAVKLLLQVVHDLYDSGETPGSSRYANSVVERILQCSEGASIDNLSYIIALVRRSAQ